MLRRPRASAILFVWSRDPSWANPGVPGCTDVTTTTLTSPLNSPVNKKNTLRALAKMAAEALLAENSQIIFTDEGLDRYQIPVSGDPIVTGLMEIYTHEDGLDVARTRVSSASFLHLSIQEFLAAVHVCLSWKDRDINTLAVVDRESRRLDNVQLFTAGLLTDTDVGHPFLQSLFKQQDNPVGKRLSHFISRTFRKAPGNTLTYRGSQFVEAMRTQNGGGWRSKPSKLAKLQIIRCVHEGKNERDDGRD